MIMRGSNVRMRWAVVGAWLLAAGAWAAEPVVVTVKGEGLSRDDAIKQALRAALEQGAGAEISSFSNVQNFELIRDQIYSRAVGLVKEYDVLSESKGPGGTVIVEIRAKVRPDVVKATWGEVQNTIDQLGRPKMMVVIEEQIDGELQPASVVAARIGEMFNKAGFEMVAQAGVAELLARQQTSAVDKGMEAKIHRLAKDAGAHIYIRGFARADRSGLEEIAPGVTAAFYNCTVMANAYWTDNASEIASESLTGERAGVRGRKEYSPQAGAAALIRATFPENDLPHQRKKLAQRLFESVMEKFMTQITGGGEVTLVVEGLEIDAYLEIEEALGADEEIDHVAAEFSEGAGIYRIRSQHSAKEWLKRFNQPPYKQWIKLKGQSMNRIDGIAREEG